MRAFSMMYDASVAAVGGQGGACVSHARLGVSPSRRANDRDTKNDHHGAESTAGRRDAGQSTRDACSTFSRCARSGAWTSVLALLLCLASAPLQARTVTLSTESLEAFVALSETNTINGWACYNYDYTRYSGDSLGGGPATSYMLKYSLDRIPKGMRITHAEWTVAHNVSGAAVNVWRVLADWGLGACYDYRKTYPEKLEWSVAGAKGKSTDRATNPTATGRFVNGQLLTVNVTQDVEMWYNGAAPNRGWLITFDSFALLHSAFHDGHRGKWQLTITYEPE